MRKLRLAGRVGLPLALAIAKQVYLPVDNVSNKFDCVGSACWKSGLVAMGVAWLPPVREN